MKDLSEYSTNYLRGIVLGNNQSSDNPSAAQALEEIERRREQNAITRERIRIADKVAFVINPAE